MEERISFKRRIKEEIDAHGIRIFPYADILSLDEVSVSSATALADVAASSLSDADRAERQAALAVREMIPFAVVGSERNVVIDGRAVRGRRTRWGLVNGKTRLKIILCFFDIK